MISLRQIYPQLTSIDILSEKYRGWGYILPSYLLLRKYPYDAALKGNHGRAETADAR